ncbi:MAG TPA: ATPase domain-containing protein [Bacteriovoracaceae bacterium]|nr:ATPase domain-containing protein [Bacteriovoracaceae bacterium]
MKKQITDRILTGVRNLDKVLHGGIPLGELTVFAGSPGSGKTTLSQQIIFKNATPEKRAIFFQTLSEPTAKTLKYLKQFSFFDPKKLEDGSIQFIDLGEIIRSDGLEKGSELLMKHIKQIQPAFVVIDSFKVFEDLSQSKEELRKFSYEIAINLMAWECTTFFLGEFSPGDIEINPLFSIIDGIITLKVRLESGEYQRFIQVMKMRGTDHSRDENSFAINERGIEIYTPKLTIQREPHSDLMMPGNGPYRAKLGISQIDDILGEGVPYGSSLLVSGVAGTGKTLLLLEFIYRGASEFDEKGVFFSFEETRERIISNAKGMGWDIEEQIKKGNIEIIFIPQPEILVEKHLLMMKEAIGRIGAKRIAIDSSSVFVHKIRDPQIVREKMYQLATLVQMAQAVGFFSTDIPYGETRISRFGVEETVVDGVILLSAINNNEDLTRDRYLEIYKLRNTAHLNGRHKMKIEHGGISIFPSSRNVTSPKKKKKVAKKVKRKK